MPFDHVLSLIGTSISCAGFVIVILQLRTNNKQRELQSLAQIFEVNRQLLTLGFAHPELFDVLADKPGVNPVIERRFLQLCLNHYFLLHSYMYESFFKRELKESLTLDLADSLAKKNMQNHWQREKAVYPARFQKFVAKVLEQIEPSEDGSGI